MSLANTTNAPANKKNMLINRFVVPIIVVICGLITGTIVDEPVVTYYIYIAFGIIALLWLIFFKSHHGKTDKERYRKTSEKR